jgi:hypothetical protein
MKVGRAFAGDKEHAIGKNLKIIDRNGVGEWTGEQQVVTSSNEWGRGWQPKWKVYGEKKIKFLK